MKKYIKTLAGTIITLCLAGGSVMLTLARGTAAEAALTEEITAVDPVNALTAAAIAGIVGIIVFIRRQKLG